MVDQARHSEGPLNNPEVAHDTRDVSFKGVILFGVSLAVLAAVVHVVIWWGMRMWIREPVKPTEPRSALARPSVQPVEAFEPSGQPKLEGLQSYAEYEQQHLKTRLAPQEYAWVDRQAGIAKIPIGLAMEIVAQQLPARQHSQADRERQKAPRLSESNSGRPASEGKP